MGPTWGRQDPGRPHVGPTYLAIWDIITFLGKESTGHPMVFPEVQIMLRFNVFSGVSLIKLLIFVEGMHRFLYPYILGIFCRWHPKPGKRKLLSMTHSASFRIAVAIKATNGSSCWFMLLFMDSVDKHCVVKVAGVLTAYFHGKLPRITAPAPALWQPGRQQWHGS